MILKVKRLNEEAVLPAYSRNGDAGLDLTAVDNGTLVSVAAEEGQPFMYKEYKTGIAVEIPEGHVGYIFPRSSISKTALSLANAVGVIDSNYRGEIAFRFKLDALPIHECIIHEDETGVTVMPATYNKGDRIGQLVVMPIPAVEIEEVTELTDTNRGEAGFGSSGA